MTNCEVVKRQRKVGVVKKPKLNLIDFVQQTAHEVDKDNNVVESSDNNEEMDLIAEAEQQKDLDMQMVSFFFLKLTHVGVLVDVSFIKMK